MTLVHFIDWWVISFLRRFAFFGFSCKRVRFLSFLGHLFGAPFQYNYLSKKKKEFSWMKQKGRRRQR